MFTWGRGRRRGPAPPALDDAYLGRLESHIGRATLRELLADGLLEIGDRAGALRRHAEAGDRAEVLALGHDLAGLAGHLGLSALSRAAVEMNRMIRADPAPSLADAADPVLSAAEEADDALRRALTAGEADGTEEAEADPFTRC